MQPSIQEICVRESLDADTVSIAAIYAYHVVHGTASLETESPTVAEIAKRRAVILARGLPYLVAEQDGAILGYADAGPYRSRAAYRHTVEDSIYLHPDAAGQGIGRALLRQLVARCEALALRQMIAVVGDSASVASIRLHESLDFRIIGVLRSVGFKHGRWLDSVMLQRALGTGDTTPPA